MNGKCPLLNQLRYCYAAAEISSDGDLLYIKFHQELNISTSDEVIRFLLKPLELDSIDCCYQINIVTPSKIYQSQNLKLSNGDFSIGMVDTHTLIDQVS